MLVLTPNTMEDFKKIIAQLFNNCQSIMDFDRTVYCRAYGEDAVCYVERISEIMPDTDNPNMRIQAMLNIAYDQGFKDCVSMVIRAMENTCGYDEESLS